MRGSTRLRSVVVMAAAIATVLSLAGCAAVKPTTTDSASTAGRTGAKSAGPRPIKSPYDTASLLDSMVQLDWFAMSIDYFYQFVSVGDWIFEDFLVRLFGLETSPYQPGQGTTLEARDPTGQVFLTLNRALLEVTDNGAWWQVTLQTDADQIVFEVLISPVRVPVLIRYVDPATQLSHEVATAIGRQIAGTDATPAQIRSRLDGELREKVAETWAYTFGNPQILGEEIIETPAGRYTAVHIEDRREGTPPGITDFWLSPDVPGQILRIVVRLPGSQDTVVTELVAIRAAVRRLIDPNTIVPIN